MKAKDKALSKMKGKKKEYMGNQRMEEQGKMKEGSAKKDKRTGASFNNENPVSETKARPHYDTAPE